MPPGLRRPNHIVVSVILSVAIFCLLVQFSSSSFSLRKYNRGSQFDIVLAHYDENPDDVRKGVHLIKSVTGLVALDPRVIVYHKGSLSTSTTDDLEALRESLNADIVRTLPNLGRESDTYLSHIIQHYDDLAGHTLFAQATLDKLEFALERLRLYWSPTVGVMSLHTYARCNCDSCQPVYGSPDPVYGFKRIPQLYSVFNSDFCPPSGLLLTFKGQFVVSRQRILNIRKEKYKWLLSVLTNTSHFVHSDGNDRHSMYTHSHNTDMTDPFFGHSIERSWMLMFGCNDIKLSECAYKGVHNATAYCACLD
jgi:Protein of unknown function (DUF3431)